jgi:ABC-type transport system substrate-binding protein
MLGGFYIQLNPRRAPFRDPGLRRRLLEQTDFFAYATVRNWVLASPATHILPYGLEEYSLFPPLHKTPPPAATGSEQPTVRAVAVNMASGIRRDFLPVLQQEFRRLGIEVVSTWAAYEEWTSATHHGDFDLTCFYYMLDVPLALHFYEQIFTSGLELNPGVAVADAQRLLAQCRREPDPRRRIELLAGLEEIARREAFLIPVFNPLAMLGCKRDAPPVALSHMLQLSFPVGDP